MTDVHHETQESSSFAGNNCDSTSTNPLPENSPNFSILPPPYTETSYENPPFNNPPYPPYSCPPVQPPVYPTAPSEENPQPYGAPSSPPPYFYPPPGIPPYYPGQQQPQTVIVNPQPALNQNFVAHHPPVSLVGPIILSCFVFWLCGLLFGGIAFIVAMVGQSSASAGDSQGAMRLRNASIALSIFGVFVGSIAIAVGVGLGVSRSKEDSVYFPYYYDNDYYSNYKSPDYYNPYYYYYYYKACSYYSNYYGPVYYACKST